VKAGWTTKPLGEVLLKTETVNPVANPDAEFNYIDVSSVSNETYEIEETQLLKGKDAPSRARRLVKAGDVIFATIRPTLKRIARVTADLDQQVCSTGYFVMRPSAELDPNYLFYSLFTEQFMSSMESLQKGASYPAVTDAEVRAQLISYPDITEQHRIVSLLDEAFADIATAKANAERNLQNARDFFAGQLQAVFDSGIDNWNSSTLGQVYDVRDGTHDSPKYHDEGFPLITSKNLKNEGLTFDDVKLISLEDYNKINERSAVHQGDVLLAMIGTIGNPTVVETIPNFAIKNVALLKVPENQNSYFLRYYLSCPSVITKMQAEAKGTTQKFVGLGYLRAFPINVPNLSEQDQMVSRLDELRAETNRLEAIYRQKLTTLDDLKKSLLHQAFSGQLTQ
jgi:type I restriction enzyme, S subunit